MSTFVDNLVINSSHNKNAALNADSLLQVLKKVWDPANHFLNQDKSKKLPGNPVLVIVPSGISLATNMYSKRFHRWLNLLSNISTIVTIQNTMVVHRKMTITTCMDQMLTSTRGKVQQIKQDYPNRPIVLAGFNSGGTLALQVAQLETVFCTIALGFSVSTVGGQRGEPDDNLLDLQSPALFVIGQIANTATQEQMEDLRERMKVETGLLVVGGADDYLRVSRKVKRSYGVTQNIVDRYIVDEIAEFLSGLLLSPYPPQIRQSPSYVHPDVLVKRGKVERKRNNSNGSSLDSEPPSPTPRNRSAKFQTMYPNTTPMMKTISGTRPLNAGNKIKRNWDSMLNRMKCNFGLVLENITFTPGPQGKLMQSLTRPEVPKMNHLLAHPDSRYRNAVSTPSSAARGCMTPLTKLLTQNNPVGLSVASGQSTSHSKLVAKKPRMKGIRKSPGYMNASASSSNISPSNLTSQDIMDLPIIFADDNQLLNQNELESSATLQALTAPMQIPSKVKNAMQVSRQIPSASKPNVLKRPAPSSGAQNPLKYTKIILSKASEDVKRKALTKLAENQDFLNVDIENDSIGKKFIIDKSTGNLCTIENSSYKTEVMTSKSVLNSKIKHAIEEDISNDSNEYRE